MTSRDESMAEVTITHRANQTNYILDSAWSHEGESLMENNTQDELKAHLMETDEEFRRLAAQHAEFHKKLEALESMAHITGQDEIEEHRLKKLKLRMKDQMNEIISRHRAQHV